MSEYLELSTHSLHADDSGADCTDVAPPIRVSTTYEYPNPADPESILASGDPIYSREGTHNSKRLELVFDSLLDGHTVVYSSGLSAFFAAMIHLNPKTVFIGTPSYHGVHEILSVFKRNYNVKVYDLDADPLLLSAGDLIHLETPVNPSSTSRDIEKYAHIAHKRGAYLLVDSTLAPPPLAHPFAFGADYIMHSATKYFGGHSDALAGVLVCKTAEQRKKLMEDRLLLGTISPSLESFLMLRSLRSFPLRIKAQVENTNRIVAHLYEHKNELSALEDISHSSLQNDDFAKRQLPLGGPPIFQLTLRSEKYARTFPGRLIYFHHCTSLGGLESSVEWRRLSEAHIDPRVVRVSVGGERFEDLIGDLVQALESISTTD